MLIEVIHSQHVSTKYDARDLKIGSIPINKAYGTGLRFIHKRFQETVIVLLLLIETGQ